MIYDRLYKDQQPAVDYVLEKKIVGIIADMRVGKTWIAGAITESLLHDNYQGLIVSLNVNKNSTWRKFFDENLPQVQLITTGDMTIQASKFQKIQGMKTLLVHYDELSKGRLIHHLKNIKWDFVCVDEIHRTKNRNSGFSKNVAKLSENSKYRVGLTGTPIDKNPIESWAQFRFLEPELFGTRWLDFAENYCRPCGYMNKDWKFRPLMMDEYMKKISPYLYYISSKDAGIIKAQEVRCMITMKGEQKRIYDEMEEHMIAEINDSATVIADLTITQIGKLQQITGGFIRNKDDQGETDYFMKNSAKIKRLKKLVSQHNEFPLVVFCKYLPEMDIIEKAMKELYPKATVARLQGKIMDTKRNKRRTNLLLGFQKGDIDILISQFKTGGSGVDMYKANVAYVYSYTHSAIDNEQVFARLNHREKENRPYFYRLMVKNSIDTDIVDSLQSKFTIKKIFIKRIQQKGRYKMPTKSPRKKAKSVSGDKPTSKKKVVKKKTASKKPTVEKKVVTKKKVSSKKKVTKTPLGFGIADIAEKMGIKEASARAALRKAGIKKTGKSYGWNSKSEVAEVVKQLS